MTETEYAAEPESSPTIGPPHKNQEWSQYSDLTVTGLRSSILSKLAKRGDWNTPFTREELNALYGALTGEYLTPKRHLYRPDHAEWQSRESMLRYVAAMAGVSEPDGAVWGENVDCPDHFRKRELVQIRKKLVETGNKMEDRLREGRDAE